MNKAELGHIFTKSDPLTRKAAWWYTGLVFNVLGTKSAAQVSLNSSGKQLLLTPKHFLSVTHAYRLKYTFLPSDCLSVLISGYTTWSNHVLDQVVFLLSSMRSYLSWRTLSPPIKKTWYFLVEWGTVSVKSWSLKNTAQSAYFRSSTLFHCHRW